MTSTVNTSSTPSAFLDSETLDLMHSDYDNL
jgi:hypothetical protein